MKNLGGSSRGCDESCSRKDLVLKRSLVPVLCTFSISSLPLPPLSLSPTYLQPRPAALLASTRRAPCPLVRSRLPFAWFSPVSWPSMPSLRAPRPSPSSPPPKYSFGLGLNSPFKSPCLQAEQKNQPVFINTTFSRLDCASVIFRVLFSVSTRYHYSPLNYRYHY